MDALNNYKLGSLFDGSGGFPLAGALCGIEPVWAAEVEPYPIAVTRSRFPNMKHLGDISKVNGAEIEPVDIITFGSPCQDLSVAGKRAGLKHEANGDEETTRSGLFMEAVRIIKEMRMATNGQYPRFALWENVPGAFSSNKGEDFRIVCEELIKIVEPSAAMPGVPKNGWAYADYYHGDGWSLAYRVFDAQYWGVPQRRRRIHLVADFRGERAKEILFEREGVRGYFEEGRTPWQRTAADAPGSTGADDREGEGFDRYNQCLTGDVCTTLRSPDGGDNCACVIEHIRGLDAVGSATYGMGGNNQPFVVMEPKCYDVRFTSEGTKNARGHCYETDSARCLDTGCNSPDTNHGGIAVVMKEPPESVICLQGNGIDRADTAGCNGKGWKEDTSYTLNTIDRPAVAYCVADHPTPKVDEKGVGFTLNARDYKAPLAVAYGLDRASFNQGQNAKFDFSVLEDQQPTLTARGPGGTAYALQSFGQYKESEHASGLKARDYKDATDLVVQPPRYIVRRLTPTECARLQGFADCWGYLEKKDSLTDEEYRFWLEVRNTHAVINGRKAQDYTEKQMLTWYNKLWTDAAEYKMWGNGIALPPALYCLQGIADALTTDEDTDDWMN